MAKSDWRGPFYAGDETPKDFRMLAWPGTTLVDATPYSLGLRSREWRYQSWWGFTYDGSSMGYFPLADGSISACLRNANTAFGRHGARPFGFYMRLQSLPSLDPESPTPKASMNTYMAGLNYNLGGSNLPTDISNNPQCAVYRVLAGNAVRLGSLFYPRIILDAANSRYLQIEFRLQNSGGDVVIDSRWNEGTVASEPGETDWTSWTTIYTDTSPGVLINGGYWGFGSGCTGSNEVASGIEEDGLFIDQIRILAEIEE